MGILESCINVNSKLQLITFEQRQWRSFGVFIHSFEQILHNVLFFFIIDLNFFGRFGLLA